jgi:hypothetical protein
MTPADDHLNGLRKDEWRSMGFQLAAGKRVRVTQCIFTPYAENPRARLSLPTAPNTWPVEKVGSSEASSTYIGASSAGWPGRGQPSPCGWPVPLVYRRP